MCIAIDPQISPLQKAIQKSEQFFMVAGLFHLPDQPWVGDPVEGPGEVDIYCVYRLSPLQGLDNPLMML